MTPAPPQSAPAQPPGVADRTPVPTYGLRRRTVRLAALSAAAAGALALSACQLASPIQTNRPYQAADGINVTIGDLKIRDLLVVSAAKGASGVLSGLVVNNGTSPVALSIGTAEGTPVTANVPGRTVLRLSGGGATGVAPLESVPSDPGAMVELTIGSPAGGTEKVQVPVLPPVDYYATVTPAPPTTTLPSVGATPTSTTTDTATQTATETATPTESATETQRP